MAEDRVGVPWVFKDAAPGAVAVTERLEGSVDGTWTDLGNVSVAFPYLAAMPDGDSFEGIDRRSPYPPAPKHGDLCPKSDEGKRWAQVYRLDFAVASASSVWGHHATAYRIRYLGRVATLTLEDIDAESGIAMFLAEFDDGLDQCDERDEFGPVLSAGIRLTATPSPDGCAILLDTPNPAIASTRGLRVASCRALVAPDDTEIGPGLTAMDQGATVWMVDERQPRLAGWLAGAPSADGWIPVVPTTDVLTFAQAIAANDDDREVTTPYLGTALAPIGDSPHAGAAEGALIATVQADSPAQAAGLHAGDIITSFDGFTVRNLTQLRHFVRTASIGDRVEVEIVRDGVSSTKEVVLAAYPSGGS